MLGPASSGSMSSPLIPVAPNGGERLALVDRLLVDIACMGELHRARRANGSEVAFKELPNDDVGLRKAAFSRRQVEGPLTNPEPGKNEPSRPNTATAVVALRDDILRVRPALHLICCLSKAQATLVTTPRQHQS